MLTVVDPPVVAAAGSSAVAAGSLSTVCTTREVPVHPHQEASQEDAGSFAPQPPAAAAPSSGAAVDVADIATAAVLAFLSQGPLAANAALDDFARR